MTFNLRSSKTWLALGVLGAILILIIGWMFVISPRFNQASSIREEAATAETSAQQLQARAARLQQQYQQLPQLQAQLASLEGLIPDQAGVEKLIQQIEQVNRTSGLQLQAFSITNPVPLTPDAGASGGTAATPPGGDAAAGATDSADAGAQTDPGTAAAQAAGQAAAASTLASLSYIPVTLDVQGGNGFPSFLAYLDALEALNRAFLITNVSITGGEAPSMSLQGQIFVRPSSN